MLRVNVMVVPNGDELRARRIGSIEIGNVTPGLPNESHYVAALYEDGKATAVKRVEVDHLRSDGWPVLVRKVLEAMG